MYFPEYGLQISFESAPKVVHLNVCQDKIRKHFEMSSVFIFIQCAKKQAVEVLTLAMLNKIRCHAHF